MGYGEYGGNGSIQVTNWMSNPEPDDCKLTKGNGALKHARDKAPSRLSARATAFVDDADDDKNRTFVGKDKTIGTDMGTFAVAVNFENAAELKKAADAFAAAVAANQKSVVFSLKVLKDTPGQVQIAWGEHVLGVIAGTGTNLSGTGV